MDDVHDEIKLLDAARCWTRKRAWGALLASMLIPFAITFAAGFILTEIGALVTIAACSALTVATGLDVCLKGSLLSYLNGRYTKVLGDPRTESLEAFRTAYNAYLAHKAEVDDLLARMNAGLVNDDGSKQMKRDLHLLKLALDARSETLKTSFKLVPLGGMRHKITALVLDEIGRTKLVADDTLADVDKKLSVMRELERHNL